MSLTVSPGRAAGRQFLYPGESPVLFGHLPSTLRRETNDPLVFPHQERSDDALHPALVLRAELPVGLDQDAGAATRVTLNLDRGAALNKVEDVPRGPADGC